jgi:hypothetical protein
MTDCLVGKPGRRRGRSVRTRVALAAGRGLEAAFVTPMARLPDAVLVLLGVLTTFARKACSSAGHLRSNVSSIYDSLLRRRSYATCRCCMNLSLQVCGM